jgi:hypothetical protein
MNGDSNVNKFLKKSLHGIRQHPVVFICSTYMGLDMHFPTLHKIKQVPEVKMSQGQNLDSSVRTALQAQRGTTTQ